MIQISCPANNIPERTYIIEYIFNDLLGCGIGPDKIRFENDVDSYLIQIGEKKIVVEDHFFQKYSEPLSYLRIENFPGQLSFFHARGHELPILYGKDKYIEEHDTITIGLDIFASSFFLLTRWEESLLGREEKGNSSGSLYTVKNNIHQRPIVNEYEAFLKELLHLYGVQTKERSFTVAMSHDVDGLLAPSWSQIGRDMLVQVIKGFPKNRVVNLTWLAEVIYKLCYPKAYNQVDKYVALCEKYHITEWFYFKVCARGEVEATYNYDDSRFLEVIDRLRKRKNPDISLGFHPSQSSFNNQSQWDKECQRITYVLGEKPPVCRAHHLLYNMPTLRMWEKSLATEESPFHVSNSVYHKVFGFRSGIAVPYPIFDYYERRKMNLIEHPCQIMDTIVRYATKGKTDAEIWNELVSIIDSVKKYQGELVLTWHIYRRNVSLINRYFTWCEKIVAYAAFLR